MTDYTDQNLNKNLVPNDSLMAGTTKPADGYTFDAETERDAIGATHIKNFSFSSGKGGTLTLGGTKNGDGLMELKNASGSLIFTGDYEGHHYYNGLGTEQVRVDSSGLHNYNTSGTEQIKVDFVGFHAYGSAGTSAELVKIDNTGFHGYLTGGTETINIGATGIRTYGKEGDTFRFYNAVGGTEFGIMGYGDSSNNFLFASENGAGLYLASDKGSGTSLVIIAAETGANISIAADGTIEVISDAFTINGTAKTAIVPTLKGYKALYTNESPEVWFMDFCEDKDEIDPMFLEVTEPPYHFIKCEGGEYQVWGIRKGFKNKRFESKTKEEFDRNNKFWSYNLKQL